MDYVLQIVTLSARVSPVRAGEIADAINEQFTLDFNPAWGTDWRCTYASPLNGSLIPQRPALYFVDEMPDPRFANYPGYHAVNAQGMPEAYVNPAHPILMAGTWTVPIITSHEALEIAANPWADRLVEGGDGFLYALEVCDPVEGQFYSRRNVGLCDFVTPEWFVAGSDGPWDRLKACDGPLRVVQGGRLFRQPFTNALAMVGAAKAWGGDE